MMVYLSSEDMAACPSMLESGEAFESEKVQYDQYDKDIGKRKKKP